MKWTGGFSAALLAVVASGSLCLAPTQSQAETLTFDLTLTSGNASADGAGTYSISINGPIASSGFETFSEGSSLTALSVTMGDGKTFNLGSGEASLISVTFDNGVFDYVTGGFNGGLSFGSSGYTYNGVSGSVADAVVTPLPTALLLFAGGLGALALSGRRRKGEHRLPLAAD